MGNFLHRQDVIKSRPASKKTILLRPNKVVDHTFKSVSQDFSDDLIKYII